MSWNPALDPHCPTGDEVDAIETVIVPRARDLGGFEVRRALPAPPPYRAGDDQLSLPGADASPGFAGHGFLDRAGRGELDGGRSRHHPFRAHR